MLFFRRPRNPLACFRTRLRRRWEGTERGARDMGARLQYEYGIQRRTRWVSEADMTVVPRNSRICSLERLIMPWRLPAWPCLSLPFAVNLKRFLAPDLVFSLGILRSPDWVAG